MNFRHHGLVALFSICSNLSPHLVTIMSKAVKLKFKRLLGPTPFVPKIGHSIKTKRSKFSSGQSKAPNKKQKEIAEASLMYRMTISSIIGAQ